MKSATALDPDPTDYSEADSFLLFARALLAVDSIRAEIAPRSGPPVKAVVSGSTRLSGVFPDEKARFRGELRSSKLSGDSLALSRFSPRFVGTHRGGWRMAWSLPSFLLTRSLGIENVTHLFSGAALLERGEEAPRQFQATSDQRTFKTLFRRGQRLRLVARGFWAVRPTFNFRNRMPCLECYQK